MPNQKNLYHELKEAGCEIDNHESDLYVKDTDKSRKIITKHGLKFDGWTVQGFRSQIDGERWFDIPFAFTPYWDKRLKRNSKYLIHTFCQKILIGNCRNEEDALTRTGIKREETFKIEKV